MTSTLLFSKSGMFRDASEPDKRHGCGCIRADDTPTSQKDSAGDFRDERSMGTFITRCFRPVMLVLFILQCRQVGADTVIMIEHPTRLMSMVTRREHGHFTHATERTFLALF